jgi:hypothetical protein
MQIVVFNNCLCDNECTVCADPKMNESHSDIICDLYLNFIYDLTF